MSLAETLAKIASNTKTFIFYTFRFIIYQIGLFNYFIHIKRHLFRVTLTDYVKSLCLIFAYDNNNDIAFIRKIFIKIHNRNV